MIDTENIAVFASGTGTNFQNILDHFKNNEKIQVCALVTNKPNCKAVQIALEYGVPIIYIDNDFNSDGVAIDQKLTALNINWIILAGFLRKIQPSLINSFSDKIINIHPSLLPKFGGKGMYGKHVHKAVIEAGEKKSGITIHLVNKEYDKGRILFQAECALSEGDTDQTLAEKIHILEKTFFPETILKVITNEL